MLLINTKNTVKYAARYGIISIDIIPALIFVCEADNYRRKSCASPGGAISACWHGIMSADIKKRLRFTAAYMRGKFAAAVKSNKRSDA